MNNSKIKAVVTACKKVGMDVMVGTTQNSSLAVAGKDRSSDLIYFNKGIETAYTKIEPKVLLDSLEVLEEMKTVNIREDTLKVVDTTDATLELTLEEEINLTRELKIASGDYKEIITLDYDELEPHRQIVPVAYESLSIRGIRINPNGIYSTDTYRLRATTRENSNVKEGFTLPLTVIDFIKTLKMKSVKIEKSLTTEYYRIELEGCGYLCFKPIPLAYPNVDGILNSSCRNYTRTLEFNKKELEKEIKKLTKVSSGDIHKYRAIFILNPDNTFNISANSSTMKYSKTLKADVKGDMLDAEKLFSLNSKLLLDAIKQCKLDVFALEITEEPVNSPSKMILDTNMIELLMPLRLEK